MNPNLPNNDKWQALLQNSAPTFQGDAAPPYGFMTSTLARLKAEKRDRDLLERIGFRAIFASLAILVATGGVTIGLQLQSHFDFDPELKSFVQPDDSLIS